MTEITTKSTKNDTDIHYNFGHCNFKKYQE